MSETFPEVRHYRRIGAEECHYPGGLVSGAHLIQMATDASGELSIRVDNDGGLLVAVNNVSLTESVRAGEALEIVVSLTKVGNRSRHKEFQVYKQIRRDEDGNYEILQPPVLIAKGEFVSVIRKHS